MKKEIKDELSSIAPDLVKIGNNNPFLVPDDYFDNLHIDPQMASEKTNGEVPSGYFEHLADEVLLKAKPQKTAKVISLNMRRWVAAASVAIICVASYLTIGTSGDTEIESFALDVELEEAIDYLAQDDDIFMFEVLDFDEYELIDEFELVDEFQDSEIDLLLDEATLEDLDELLL